MKIMIDKNHVVYSAMLFLLLFLLLSCSKEEECESNNTGELTFQNTNEMGSLQVYINEFGRIAANGQGDVSIPPGESRTIELPPGPQNLKAILIVSTCNGGSCFVSTTGRPEREVDLASCEELSIIY